MPRPAAPAVRRDTPVQFLKGVGEKRAEQLARLGIATALDLAWHLPHRYLDASSLTPLASARVGEEIAAVGRVVATRTLPTRKGLRIFHAVLRDDSGLLECTWPGQPYLERVIRQGQLLLVSGPVRFYHGRQCVPREFVVLGDADTAADHPDAGRILPIYPATEGLGHRFIRSLVDRYLDALLPHVEELLPERTREALGLPGVQDALRWVHRPASLAEAELGRRRLAFDELFDVQLMLARARALAKRERAGVALVPTGEFTGALRRALPWELTDDQKRALKEILADMGAAERMHRLLMGDVGTGKTVVALLAMLVAVENGQQAALMAPTELLAEQHAATMAKLLAPIGIVPEVLLGRQPASEKAAVRRRLGSGAARIVIGTHALFQETVAFKRLGLVVIDEQHRFGVEQRAALIGKGAAPDVLLLTATPIPRSLALTLYGDLDVSVLRQRPPGRGRIRTAVRTAGQREGVLQFVHEECRRGRQAYVVLPVIDETEKADLRAATTMAEQLAERFPDVAVGLVHGRLKPDARDAVMRRFRDGQVHVLVATTVIEVGIDVPNATVMLIEHPERFGLAQLHQLRGRVGRGEGDSYCILQADDDVPPRLEAFARTTDGFKVAELDLEERGMGDLIGARQSGGISVRHAKLPDDADLLEVARMQARAIVEEDPTLSRPQHAGVRERALARFPRAVELFRTG
jgi:ATP-dependent DNA helicase RecG